MTEWNQFEGDPQHSGRRRDLEGPRRVETAWTADLVGPVGSPVLDRDTVFVGTERGNVYAFERETGRRRWTVDALTATDAAPVVTREHLFFGTDDAVSAVDPATGDRQWETELPGSPSTALTLADGRLYAGHEAGVSALEADTGEIRWTHETDAPIVGSPAIARGRDRGRDRNRDHEQDQNHELEQGLDRERERDRNWNGPRVYVATANEAVSALEAETGESIWTAPTNGVVTAGPTVADGRVYVGDDDGTLLALDVDTGQTWFTYRIEDAFTSSVTVLPDEETTFVGAADGYLHVTDTTFGRRKLRGWLFSKKGVALDGAVRASPVVVGDVCCVADTSGSLYGLDVVDDCSHLWHVGTDGAITSTPAVGEEQLFVGDDEGRLYCLTWTPGEPRP